MPFPFTRTIPKTSAEDMDLIVKIADRAIEIGDRVHVNSDKVTWIMDLVVVHGSIRLDLAGLLAASENDFTHDVFGIRAHMDRDAGVIRDAFLPRYVLAD